MLYPHNIQLDNVNIDILLEPAKNLLIGKIPNRTQNKRHSKTMLINSSFIDTIISVAEGGLIASVVKSKTCAYSGQKEFSLSHRITEKSCVECYTDEDLLTELATQRVAITSSEFDTNFDKSETLILDATRIGNFGDLAYFLGVDIFTFIDGLQYVNPTGIDKKTRLNTYEVRDQHNTFSWYLSLLFRFETDFCAPLRLFWRHKRNQQRICHAF